MVWQDYVIATCQLFFVVAMVPTLRGREKPPFSTNIMNTVLVTIITTMLATLNLWFSALTAAAVGVSWAALSLQTLKPRR